jgi:peptidoglycan lytic transglycosylase
LARRPIGRGRASAGPTRESDFASEADGETCWARRGAHASAGRREWVPRLERNRTAWRMAAPSSPTACDWFYPSRSTRSTWRAGRGRRHAERRLVSSGVSWRRRNPLGRAGLAVLVPPTSEVGVRSARSRERSPVVKSGFRQLAFASFSLLLLLNACSTVRRVTELPVATTAETRVGTASWYGRLHQGKRTASGERFDRYAMTAAHPSLPFGSRVRVTNLENGRSEIVRVNDRGPYVSGRIIDLSYAAARALGIARKGLARVRVTRVR